MFEKFLVGGEFLLEVVAEFSSKIAKEKYQMYEKYYFHSTKIPNLFD